MQHHITHIYQIDPQSLRNSTFNLSDTDSHSQAIYRAVNREQRPIAIYQTDQGNANPERRCDFLLHDPERRYAWYIELKGKNHWDVACEQLLNTYQQYSEEIATPKERTYFRLVASSPRTGMRVFRSYSSFRQLMLILPRDTRNFEVMFSSISGFHRDYEDLESVTVIAIDATLLAASSD